MDGVDHVLHLIDTPGHVDFKKRMKTIGRVEVPQEAFVAALSTDGRK